MVLLSNAVMDYEIDDKRDTASTESVNGRRCIATGV